MGKGLRRFCVCVLAIVFFARTFMAHIQPVNADSLRTGSEDFDVVQTVEGDPEVVTLEDEVIPLATLGDAFPGASDEEDDVDVPGEDDENEETPAAGDEPAVPGNDVPTEEPAVSDNDTLPEEPTVSDNDTPAEEPAVSDNDT